MALRITAGALSWLVTWMGAGDGPSGQARSSRGPRGCLGSAHRGSQPPAGSWGRGGLIATPPGGLCALMRGGAFRSHSYPRFSYEPAASSHATWGNLPLGAASLVPAPSRTSASTSLGKARVPRRAGAPCVPGLCWAAGCSGGQHRPTPAASTPRAGAQAGLRRRVPQVTP